MIDGGLRTSRPGGGQNAYRRETVRRQPEEIHFEEPEPMREAPRQIERPRPVEVEVDRPKQSRDMSWLKRGVVVIAIALAGALAWKFMPTQGSIASTIDSGKYQAVFLSNGQVYFGRLTIVDNDFMKLTNVYYLERQLTATPTENDDDEVDQSNPTGNENSFQLLKYSDVLYGSEDAMIISIDDIIRYENLRPDGVVAKAIANRN